MKRREFLAIFLSALLITWGSGFFAHNPCHECRDAFYDLGWPLMFYQTGGFFGVNRWFWSNLILDFLFWFLVLAVGWQLMKWTKQRISQKVG